MITVSVASYNHRPYIRKCLESIVAQSYPELELCWVDDCSVDETFDELRTLTEEAWCKARFTRILLKRNRVNRGAPFSLNLAARMGRGELISFMNSDDYYSSERLERCASQYTQGGYFFWFSNVLPVDSAGSSLVVDPTGERVAFDADILVRRLGGVSRALLSRQIAASTGNFIVSRRLFDVVGGFQNLKYCHDWMFALKASRFCEPLFDTDRLYYYRLHPTNSFRGLADLAEMETRTVLSEFFEAVALGPAVNPSSPCPRRQPSGFWELLQATNTTEIAERVFFPYSRATRILSSRSVRALS